MRTLVRGFVGFCAFAAVASTPLTVRADEIEACAAAAEKGQELRDQSKLVEARESLVRCAQSSCPKLIRSDCEKWLPETEARIPTVVLRVVDGAGSDLANVKVERDGTSWLDTLDGTAIPVNPGATKLTFSADGYGSVDKEIVVAEGQRGRIIEVQMVKAGSGAATPGATTPESQPPADASDGGPGPLPWIMAGVGVLGVGTFAVTQILASGEVSDVEDGCGASKSCGDADLDPIRTKLTISAIGLGVGIAGIGASIALFALMGGDSKSGSAVQVTPVVGPTTAGAFVDVPLSF